MSKEPKEPKGIVVTLSSPDGAVVATASDFKDARYSGFDQAGSQRIRARRMLALNLIADMCSTFIARAIDGHDAERIRDNLTRLHGFKETIIEIGYDEEQDSHG